MENSLLMRFLLNASDVTEKANFKEHRAALLSIADTISVAMASHSIDARVKNLKASLLEGTKAKGEAAIFGNKIEKADDITALAINSFASHSLELDNWLPLGMLHPSSSIVPAAILLAQKKDLSLEDVADGIIYGYQLSESLGRWLGRSYYKIWHTTSTIGGMSVAAMLSWMDENDDERIMNSLLLALTYSGGHMPLINKLVSIKPVSPMHASIIGYYSFKMNNAFKGLIREADGIESKICGNLSNNCATVDETWDQESAVSRLGYKIFPACRNSHTTIQAAIKLSGKVDLNSIESIELEVFEEAAQVADIRSPTTLEEAMFSLSFLTVTALAKKWVGFKEIQEALSDTFLRELEKKVKIRVRDDYTAFFPEKHPITLKVKLKDGGTLEEYEEIPYGDLSHNISDEAIIEKLRSLSEYSGNKKILKFVNLILKENIDIKINELIEKISTADSE